VAGYLSKGRQAHFMELSRKAYNEPTYEGVKTELMRVKKQLSLLNKSAVRSLKEGLEQTLTLHRLGLFEKPGKGLKTTNWTESIMALTGQRTDRVDYWRNSKHKDRWLATALLHIENRLNRTRRYKYLP